MSAEPYLDRPRGQGTLRETDEDAFEDDPEVSPRSRAPLRADQRHGESREPQSEKPPSRRERARRKALERAAARKGGLWTRGWRSPLTRRILLLNLLVLVIPVFGLLHLNQYRQSLIATEMKAMRTQAQAFAWALGNTAAVGAAEGEERLYPEIARSLLRVLLDGTELRARIFDSSGALITDSFMLTGPGGPVQVVELPPPDDGSLTAWLGGLYDRATDWLPGMGPLPRYREAALQKAADYPEAVEAMGGERAGRVRLDDNERLILTMAVPVQRYRQVLGVLMISKDGDAISKGVQARRRDIMMVLGVAFLVTVGLSIYLASTIARPIRRLALAAALLRYGKGRKYEIPDFSHRRDEIGELSAALREMTQGLWNRIDAIEHFAADVSHEIKNPLTSLRSAVETVARVEDPEQQRKLMTIILDDVQRLDRLISDISDASRLDAELSRAESEAVDIGRLLQALMEVHSATVGDDGPRFELNLPPGRPLIVQGLEGRLGQVFRNLISNAVTFSPKGGTIRLSAWREEDWAVVTVEDEGPGIPEGKLESVFDRFYSERPEGEKFGTHSGLGLSISRQIIQAHRGEIRAENRRPGEEGGGARFVIRLPLEA